MNCKDKELNAKLYSNRAAAHFNLGKKLPLKLVMVMLSVALERLFKLVALQLGTVL